MKTVFLIPIITGIVITLGVWAIFSYQDTYAKNCESGGGFMTGFLSCTKVYKDFANDVGYDKSELWQMHDVIVEGQVTAFTNDTKPWVVLKVDRYLKNPQNATYLTVWGDLGLNGDYCLHNRSECDKVVAYLYKNKNGIYRQGETFAWITRSCDVNCITGIR